MANQRAAGQTLIAFPLDEQFLQELDRARGDKSRSAFVREALYKYLTEEHRMALPRSLIKAPDRAGKGGRPTKAAEKAILNDAPNPDAATERKPVKYPSGRKKPPKKK